MSCGYKRVDCNATTALHGNVEQYPFIIHTRQQKFIQTNIQLIVKNNYQSAKNVKNKSGIWKQHDLYVRYNLLSNLCEASLFTVFTEKD